MRPVHREDKFTLDLIRPKYMRSDTISQIWIFCSKLVYKTKRSARFVRIHSTFYSTHKNVKYHDSFFFETNQYTIVNEYISCMICEKCVCVCVCIYWSRSMKWSHVIFGDSAHVFFAWFSILKQQIEYLLAPVDGFSSDLAYRGDIIRVYFYFNFCQLPARQTYVLYPASASFRRSPPRIMHS